MDFGKSRRAIFWPRYLGEGNFEDDLAFCVCHFKGVPRWILSLAQHLQAQLECRVARLEIGRFRIRQVGPDLVPAGSSGRQQVEKVVSHGCCPSDGYTLAGRAIITNHASTL